MRIIDKHTGKQLTDLEILEEANRDHSDQFIPYTMEDLKTAPVDILDWIDPQYYEVTL
jgi:hypothetical protein